jgi:integral membrane protein
VSPKTLGYVALLETISWTVLIVATLVKYIGDKENATQIPGMVHGFLFVGLVALTFLLQSQGHWKINKSIKIILLSFIPIGGYFLIDHAVDEEASTAQA